MSTATTTTTNDSVKQPSGEDEPSSKKVKLADGDAATVNNKTTTNDANNKTTAMKNDVKNVDNNNGNQNSVPSKSSTSNGASSDNKLSGEDVSTTNTASDDKEDDAEGAFQFDPKIAKNLEQCERIQSEICNLNEKASEEILKVEQKFNKLRRPHFEKRNELLKEVPNFWLTSLANHQIIAPMIESAEDEDCLHYMVNLDVEEFEDIKSGYRLKLHFVENPYITNEVIVKEFNIVNSDDVQSSSTPVEYKNTRQGKALKQVVENSTAQFRRSRRPGQMTTQQSFFAWLVEPSDSGPDEVAEILKDQIWPNPLEFFFASPDEYGDDTDDDESDDEDEEIDDEDLDDDEDNVITEGDVNESFDEEAEIEEDGDDDDEDEDDEDDDEGNEE